MKIFTVFDIKANCYLQPFFSQTEGTAIRAFQQAANDQEHDFHKFAEDYTLFELGEWHERSGQINMLPAIKPLGNAIQYIINQLPPAKTPFDSDDYHGLKNVTEETG